MMPRPAPLFVTDADNTLWDTDAVFRAAQLSLLEASEQLTGETAAEPDRLQYVRAIDQALAQAHHGGLRYPPILLADALQHVLTGTPLAQAVRKALKGSADEARLGPIAERFVAGLRAPPPLRVGVSQGLRQLSRAGQKLVVATEGPKEKVEALLQHHGLAAAVRTVLSAPKTVELYRRLAGLSAGPRLMVGDQTDRDITPAQAAGFFAVWFPGGFAPVWGARQDARPDLEIDDFRDAVTVFHRLVADSLPQGRTARVSRKNSTRLAG